MGIKCLQYVKCNLMCKVNEGLNPQIHSIPGNVLINIYNHTSANIQ